MIAPPVAGDPMPEEITNNLLAIAAIGRRPVDIGAFRAFFADGDDDTLFSVAVPMHDSDDWSAELADLTRAAAARRRLLRIEFLEEQAPALAPILELAGFRCDSARPAMLLAAADLRVVAGTPPLRFVRIRAEDAPAIDAFQAVQEASFGPALADDVRGWRPILLDGLAAGSMVAALGLVDEQPVAAASLLIGGGAAELVGVGVRPEHRGRGLASALCYRLLADHFADSGTDGGSHVWLSADETARALYGRLGFRPVGTHVIFGVGRR